jgi:hypothetical protein
LLFCILLPTTAIAGPLDDYYLARFSLAPVVAGAVTTTTGATTQPPERCGTPLRHDLQHDWSRLQPETQKALQKVLARPALAGEKTFTSPGGHFTIHYAASGTDAPPAADLNADGIPDWVRTVADTFETVYAAEVGTMLYRAAPTNGNAPYDVYLQDQPSGQFGVRPPRDWQHHCLYQLHCHRQ